MTVYFAQARTDLTTVKIGFTSDLGRRQQNLSSSTPGGVSILATVDGGKETEDFLHEKFAAHRLGGEWFKYSDDIRDFIRDILNGKQGLVPFRDEAVYMQRSTAEHATDALARARQMATEIVEAELRGIRDTIGAAKHRIERKYGLKASMLHRVIYRSDMSDVSAGVYLHLCEIHDHIMRAKRAAIAASYAETGAAISGRPARVQAGAGGF